MKKNKVSKRNNLLIFALNSRLTDGSRYDWQISEKDFLIAYGYPDDMTGAAEKFLRKYHRELVSLAKRKGLLNDAGETCI